jgi:hypothetical protein
MSSIDNVSGEKKNWLGVLGSVVIFLVGNFILLRAVFPSVLDFKPVLGGYYFGYCVLAIILVLAGFLGLLIFLRVVNNIDEAKHRLSQLLGPLSMFYVGLYLYMMAIAVKIVVQINPNGEDVLHKLTQDPLFGYAGLFFILVSVVWALYVFNLLKSFIGIGVAFVLGVVAFFILQTDYSIVKEDVDYQQKHDRYFLEMKGRLNDVKKAEIEFKKEFGVYTNNMDSLIDYIKNGKTVAYNRSGLTPARALSREEADFLYPGKNIALDNYMTDIEAKDLLRMEKPWHDLEGYIRDTIYVSVLETVFMADSYVESRNKKLEFDFNADSLRYIPFSGVELFLDTASISRGEIVVPTLLLRMIHPEFLEDTLEIGDLKDNSLKDNWSAR